jgi:AraC family transcriptional activator of pobA
MEQKPLTLIDPKNGNLAFKIFSYSDNSYFDHVQRNNYYSIIINLKGNGKLKSDFSFRQPVHDVLFTLSALYDQRR